MKKYNGSTIGVLSSHLFLLASLFNYYYNNIIECISIFILYITSIFYHYNGENNNSLNINYKIIDEYCCRIVILICIILSLPKYNIYPTLATLFISIMYYNKINYTNILHSILIHLPGTLGFFSIYYNYNNHNSHIFILWISLIIISLLYLVYYEFYVSYKINLLYNNIKNLKIGSIN
jgi:hypothetical protein